MHSAPRHMVLYSKQQSVSVLLAVSCANSRIAAAWDELYVGSIDIVSPPGVGGQTAIRRRRVENAYPAGWLSA